MPTDASSSECRTECRTAYYYRPVVAEDLPYLLRGLQETDVRRWWGEPEHELALIRGDLENPLIELRLVLADAVPVAYIQDYAVDDWPQDHLLHLPPATRAIDTFVATPDAMGMGHCGRYLRQRAQVLLSQGCPLVVIDPDPENIRAIRAYKKAGFSTNHRHARRSEEALVMVYIE